MITTTALLVDTNHSTTAVIEPTGCDGINVYYYRILLTVTDPQGLATTQEVRLYPGLWTKHATDDF